MSPLPEAIAKYIEALVAARDRCARSEDRLTYTKHLAAAAEMNVAAQRSDLDQLHELLAAEERNYGWGYLSGEAGSSAERAFQELERRVRSMAGG